MQYNTVKEVKTIAITKPQNFVCLHAAARDQIINAISTCIRLIVLQYWQIPMQLLYIISFCTHLRAIIFIMIFITMPIVRAFSAMQCCTAPPANPPHFSSELRVLLNSLSPDFINLPDRPHTLFKDTKEAKLLQS